MIETTNSDAAPMVSGRSRLLPWRIVFVLSLASITFLWFKSTSQIHHRLLSVGSGGVEVYVAGSSAAISIMTQQYHSVEFGGSLGPPDAEQLLHYDARWIDGDPLGRVSNSCLFPPDLDTLERTDLDRMGSFGLSLTSTPTPFGSAPYLHFRLPFWFLVFLLAGCWFWLERRATRRCRDQATGVHC